MMDMPMRLVVLTLMIASVAAPALAQSDPSWQRRRNEALMAQDAAIRQSQNYEREARAREQRARTDATLRAIQAGELAGGPSVAYTPYRPSDITPVEPAPRTTVAPPPLTADAARMDELMASALARSNARVRAVTADKR